MQPQALSETSLVRYDHPPAVNRIAFAAVNDLVATADTSMSVKVWHKGNVIRTFDLHGLNEKAKRVERMRGLAFDPSGTLLFVATSEALVAFDVSTGGMAWEFEAPRQLVFLIQGPTAVAVAPNGNVLAPFEDGSYGLWQSNGLQLAYRRHAAAPRLLAFTSDGTRFVGSDMQACYVYDASTFEKIAILPVRSRILAIAMNPREDFVALRTLDEVSVVSLETRSEVLRVPTNAGLPLVALSPSARLLAIGDRNGVNLVDAHGTLRRRILVDGATLTSLAFSANGALLALGASDGRLRFHALRTMISIDEAEESAPPFNSPYPRP